MHAKNISDEDTTWIKDKMAQHKTVERSFLLASKLSDEAMKAMSNDEQLVAILQTMIKRSY
jgi:octaprenyl-diphosphate synthase